MRKLHFTPGLADTRDPDVRIISDEELKKATKEGEENG